MFSNPLQDAGLFDGYNEIAIVIKKNIHSEVLVVEFNCNTKF